LGLGTSSFLCLEGQAKVKGSFAARGEQSSPFPYSCWCLFFSPPKGCLRLVTKKETPKELAFGFSFDFDSEIYLGPFF
jgi:hypothetical protein